MNQSIKRHGMLIASLFAISFAVVGCKTTNSASSSQAAVSSPMDKAEQTAITPDAALHRLMDGNHRFTHGTPLHRDSIAQAKAAAAGQYPFAVVLSCIDSRCAPEIVFDQGIGDLFVPRVAGNYAPVDLLGSMEFATKVAGAKLILVVGHSECGAIKGACDNVELGNLTTVMHALRPAVDEVKDVPADQRTSKNKRFVQEVAEANVRDTVAHIRAASPILRDMESSGQIKILGAMQDLATGEVALLK